MPFGRAHLDKEGYRGKQKRIVGQGRQKLRHENNVKTRVHDEIMAVVIACNAITTALEHLSGKIGKARALATHERDVPIVLPSFEAIYYVGKAGTAFGQVWSIDLGNIP